MAAAHRVAPPPAGPRAYARSVEAAWSRVRGRPTVLSPRDFELVERWRREGIPLAVVLEVLNDEHRRSRSGGARTLGVLAARVREAGEAVAAGRSAPVAARPPAEDDRGAALVRAHHAAPDGSPLRALLGRALAAREEGLPASSIDALVDGELPGAAPPDLRRRCEAQAAEALEVYRGRMDAATYRATLERAGVDRLREALALPRLALAPASRPR